MKASIQVAQFTWPGGDAAIGPTLARIGEAADAGGVDTVWVMDHYFQLEPMLGPADSPMLEAYTALAFLASGALPCRVGRAATAPLASGWPGQG